MSVDPLGVPLWVECLAVGAGALFGAFSAVNERMAVTGVLALAAVTGVGGGIIRDTLLQTGPPVALAEPVFLPVTIGAAVIAFVSARLLGVAARDDHPLLISILVFDAMAVGIYAIVGIDKGLQVGLPIVGATLVGVLSGTGGSVTHDLLVGRPPALLRPGILLGVAASVGCAARGDRRPPRAPPESRCCGSLRCASGGRSVPSSRATGACRSTSGAVAERLLHRGHASPPDRGARRAPGRALGWCRRLW